MDGWILRFYDFHKIILNNAVNSCGELRFLLQSTLQVRFKVNSNSVFGFFSRLGYFTLGSCEVCKIPIFYKVYVRWRAGSRAPSQDVRPQRFFNEDVV